MSQKRQSHARRTTSERQLPGWLWLLTGMILGAFIMFIVHLNNIKQDTGTNSAPSTPKKQNKTRLENDVTGPVFEFYDRLKQENIEVPQHQAPTQTEIESAATHEYFLQVASFRTKDDADRLRAKLTLLNLEPYIESSKLNNGELRYRVIIGPYKNSSTLSKARQTLLANGLEFLTLKREINKK